VRSTSGAVRLVLPKGAVEVPCLVNQHGCLPTSVAALPEQLAAMNRVAINVQTLTVEAAITGNRDAVYQAAMMDPLLAAQLPLSRIWHLVDEMFQAHGTTLPTYSSRRLWAYDH
jgi:alpha-galactosidase